MSQIYRKILKGEEFIKAKNREDNIEEKLELYLKSKNKFNLFLEYEEVRGEFLNKILKEYYIAGFKDGIAIIIDNVK